MLGLGKPVGGGLDVNCNWICYCNYKIDCGGDGGNILGHLTYHISLSCDVYKALFTKGKERK